MTVRRTAEQVYRCFFNSLYYISLPGTILHELSHAFFVLLSDAKITELELTKHVKHKGQYTFRSVFLISYAPLLVNTVVSLFLALVFLLQPDTSLIRGVIKYLAVYGSFAIGVNALPSYEDAVAPWVFFTQVWEHSKIYALFGFPFLLIFGLPGLIGFFITDKSRVLRWIVDGMYFASLIWVAMMLSVTPTVQRISNFFIF